ncbi:hypothetical protein J5X84_16055 [Streptosporangiaceae bacterium NEAU-GS5]|nr:hypothetical protein [Streptosporangiaceae bacterium NEAU-GS5]
MGGMGGMGGSDIGGGGAWGATVPFLASSAAFMAFFAFPVTSMPFLGAVTGLDLVGEAASRYPELALLWLIPLSAAIAAGLGIWIWSGSTVHPATRRQVAAWIIAAAFAVVVAYLAALIRLSAIAHDLGGMAAQMQVSTSLGAGFWMPVLGMIATGGGALVKMHSPHS